MRRLFTLALLIVVGVVAWNERDRILAAWAVLRGGAEVAPSAELAASAQAKLARLSNSEPERVALSEAEVQSLLQYRVASYLPEYIVAPRVTLDGNRLHVQAQVPTTSFPRIDELESVVGFLPDTTTVKVSGQLIPLDDSRVGLAVDELSAARVPLPRGLIPMLLQRFGRTNEPGLPPDALALPLPAGATTAYVRADSLIFVPRTSSER